MPRIRTVKPAYPKHRKVRKVSRDARLLNIHLWNLADDEGRLQELPQWIIGEVFPTDEDVTPGRLREWLQELSDEGLILRYEVEGEQYIFCHDFLDHQKISHPTKSTLPAPPAGLGRLRESSGNPPVGPEESLSPEEEKEREEEKEEEAAAAPDQLRPIIDRLERVSFSRGLRSPKVAPVVEVCGKFSDRDLEAEAEKFAHYWIDGPGEKRPLTDVAWSWRGWLERAKDKPAGNPRSTVAADLKRLEAEHAAAVAEEARA